MLVDCFLPAVVDVTPAWMADDYSAGGEEIIRRRSEEFDEFEVPEWMGTASGSVQAESTAAQIASDEPTESLSIGHYFNPQGEDEHSLLWNPVVKGTIAKLGAEIPPDHTLKSSRLSNPNILGLKNERHTEVFSAFGKIDLQDLMSVLSNTVLTDKFSLELSISRCTPSASRLFSPQSQDDKLIAQTKLKLHPNTSSAANLQMHVVHTLTLQIHEKYGSDPDRRNLALDLRNQIKANCTHILNDRFVKTLTDPNGIENIKFSLNRTLIGYTAKPTE